MKKLTSKIKNLLKRIAKPFDRVNRLGMKMMLLTLGIIFASEALSFTATIIINFVTGGEASSHQIISLIAASLAIGAVLAFIVSNTILKPLSNITKAAKRVRGGDYSARVEKDFASRYTLKELQALIDDFNAMAEELASVEIFRNDFIGNFSHEFKTPLASIRGFARQLYGGNLTEEQTREFSKIILDETEYLSELAQNTQLLTRLENNDSPPQRAEYDLSEQLRTCMLRLEPAWSRKNILIDMGDMDEVKITAEETLLAHVWNNLFDNAVKFTPEGGKITVKCSKTEKNVQVSVADSGCGIPEEALSRIFEKFYQADASHAAKGNGLGLALVKKIVERSGGEVKVRSEEGKGAEFTVRLPAL